MKENNVFEGITNITNFHGMNTLRSIKVTNMSEGHSAYFPTELKIFILDWVKYSITNYAEVKQIV